MARTSQVQNRHGAVSNLTRAGGASLDPLSRRRGDRDLRVEARHEPDHRETDSLGAQIRDDVAEALELSTDKVKVTLRQKARGGISITATA